MQHNNTYFAVCTNGETVVQYTDKTESQKCCINPYRTNVENRVSS